MSFDTALRIIALLALGGLLAFLVLLLYAAADIMRADEERDLS